MKHTLSLAGAAAVAVLALGSALAPSAAAAGTKVIGEILACYACQDTGNSVIDNYLANGAGGPTVASDGLLFAFVNTSGAAITGGKFTVSNSSANDSFSFPTIAAGGTFILVPGVTNDGGSHSSGAFFNPADGVWDTSDQGLVTGSAIWTFTGSQGALEVTSPTNGASKTAPAGSFTSIDPGLIQPWRVPANGGSTDFLGQAANGDPGCSNCYFYEIAKLVVPTTSGVPEPADWALMILGMGVAGASLRQRRTAPA
ncbi:MAG TPA: PEPxxWA-CTERM sorting domain-containing protein [Caulobacteraceae bacterium]|nr:PEPxxWA-CTERM sorting domain-containing protein [Caulobacteraceae bacterium]